MGEGATTRGTSVLERDDERARLRSRVGELELELAEVLERLRAQLDLNHAQRAELVSLRERAARIRALTSTA